MKQSEQIPDSFEHMLEQGAPLAGGWLEGCTPPNNIVQTTGRETVQSWLLSWKHIPSGDIAKQLECSAAQPIKTAFWSQR